MWTDDAEWTVISYLRTEPTDMVDGLDLEAFADDAVTRGSVEEGWFLTSVQAGFEIWQGGADLASQSFSVMAEHGGCREKNLSVSTAEAPSSRSRLETPRNETPTRLWPRGTSKRPAYWLICGRPALKCMQERYYSNKNSLVRCC